MQDIRATAERGGTLDRLGGDLATLSGGDRPTEFEKTPRRTDGFGGDPGPMESNVLGDPT